MLIRNGFPWSCALQVALRPKALVPPGSGAGASSGPSGLARVLLWFFGVTVFPRNVASGRLTSGHRACKWASRGSPLADKALFSACFHCMFSKTLSKKYLKYAYFAYFFFLMKIKPP